MGYFIFAAILYFAYRFLLSVIKYLSWKRKINTTALVKELKNKNVVYKDKKQTKPSYTEYTYLLEFIINGQIHTAEVSEIMNHNKPGTLLVNSRIPVFVDYKTKQVKCIGFFKDDIKHYALSFVIYTAVLVVFYVLIAMIFMKRF